jgi:hypothetical protein
MSPAPDFPDQPLSADADPTHALHTALQAVLACLHRMDVAHFDPALAQQIVTLTNAALAVDAHLYRHMPPPTLDRGVFDRLMRLAGPETSHDLLDRLVEDLMAVQHHMTTTPNTPAWDILRNQSHILIGLAGAVGATDVQALAQDVNTLANQMQPVGLSPLLTRLTPALDALIHFIRAQRIAGIAAQ